MNTGKLKRYSMLLISPVIIIAIAIVLRIVPHPPNFAPIAAMALFGGAYLNPRYAIVVPLVALFASDLFIGFYSPLVMLTVYGSFVFTGLIGIWLKKRRNPRNILITAVGSSILFFLITNFGVWAAGMYGHGLDGLLTSYIMGLPFFRGTLVGDLFYTGVFFGGYELVLRLVKKPALAIAKNSS